MPSIIQFNQRCALITLILLWVAGMSPAILRADDGTVATPKGEASEAQPTGTSGAPAIDKAPPISPSAAAAVLQQLQQLKDAVQAQEQKLEEHSREIESERVTLRDELAHITKLESQLLSAAPESIDAVADSSMSAPFVAPDAPASVSAISNLYPAVSAQRASTSPSASGQAQASPAQGSVDRRLSALEQRLKSLGPLTFSGDFRLREDAFFGGPSDQSLDQNVQNYRLRFNTDIQLSDDFSGGFTLASGNLNDPTSTNQSITGFYARKPIALDRAFIHYHPKQFKPLDLVAGKFSYPWYNTELVWDKDLNPEGFGQTLNFGLSSTPVLKRVAFIGFELPFSQVAGVSLQNKSLVQSAIYGGQVQATWKLTPWLDLSTYTAFYNFHNADPIALALAKAGAKNPATPLIGLLPLAGGGGTVQDSITTTTATSVVNVGGTAVPTGVTSVTNAQFASKFGLTDSIARFDVKTPSERWPVALIGDYVQNTEACANVGNILRAAANTTTTVYSQSTNFACDSHQRRAYWLEAEVGRILNKHDLQFSYTRMFIEREAVLSNFNYNQMYQGSNVSEHRLSVFYTLRSNVIFDFIGLFGRPLNFGNPNPPINSLKRLQFDVNYVF